MLQLLKIASVLMVIAAFATVGILGYSVYTGKASPDVLSDRGPSETLTDLNPNAEQEKTAPLVVQALAFSLKIDPPPISTNDIITNQGSSTKLQPRDITNGKKDTVISKPGVVKLIATCRYDKNPEKSLALINTPAKGNEWYRQGEAIEHRTVYEVKDGSVILYQGDTYDDELFMPQEKVFSLLKTDESTSIQATVTGSSVNRTSTSLPRGRPGPRIPGKSPRVQAPRTRTKAAAPSLEYQKIIAESELKAYQAIMDVSDLSAEDKSNMAGFLKVLADKVKKLDEKIQESKASKPDDKPK